MKNINVGLGRVKLWGMTIHQKTGCKTENQCWPQLLYTLYPSTDHNFHTWWQQWQKNV